MEYEWVLSGGLFFSCGFVGNFIEKLPYTA